MTMENSQFYILFGLQMFTFLMIVSLVFNSFAKTDPFLATVQSVPQAVNLTSSRDSTRSDGVYQYERPYSFLGGPEPPVFYDIGDVSAARAAVGGTMGAAQKRGVNTASSASGFMDLDQLLVNSSR
jgi:hypothetical protein